MVDMCWGLNASIRLLIEDVVPMLKVYTVKSFVSIDDGEWQKVGTNGHLVADDATIDCQKIFFKNITFNQCWKLLDSSSFDGIYKDYTLFRRKPCIYVKGHNGWIGYKSFNSISYKYVYEEDHYASLDWIMKHCSAEQCIQYLKDRGMTVCPMVK